MKLSSTIALLSCASTKAAFVPHSTSFTTSSPTILKGYLDDLSADLYKEDATPDVEADSRESNAMAKEQVDRYGPGNLADFVEFDEFDGGDGQMGVAGDGSTGLDKSEFETGELAKSLDKSRMRSARVGWGSSTGYADELVQKGVDSARAQQLENWHTQQEIKKQKDQQKFMSESFDQVEQNADADWRSLAKFGVERNEDFDMNETFGAVTAYEGELEGTIELTARPGTMTGGTGYHEFGLKNPYMGFADFRAAFTEETPKSFSISPNEGSLTSREPTQFKVTFRPEAIGVLEGYLVIETEDFKKVWKVIGSTN